MSETEKQKIGKPVIPLLIQPDYAAYEWGKAQIDAFYKAAAKAGLRVIALHSWKDAVALGDDHFLIIIGSDGDWLRKMTELLYPERVRVLLTAEHAWDSGASHIFVGQDSVIKNSVRLLKERGKTAPAMFGIQKGDVSDERKAKAFAELVATQDVFWIDGSANETFERFFARIGQFDGVICSNDAMAVYLMKQLREKGVSVPDDLFVIGNGNLHIASCITPTLTSIIYDVRMLADVALRICLRLGQLDAVDQFDIRLNGTVAERQSTGASLPSAAENAIRYRSASYIDVGGVSCPELRPICAINQVLSLCTPNNRLILRRLVEGRSYDEIAQETVLSPDTVKYHVKRIYRWLGVHRRDELQQLMRAYRVRL